MEVDGNSADRDSAVGVETALDDEPFPVLGVLGLSVHGHAGACWEVACERTVCPRALVVAAFTLAFTVQEGDRRWPVLVAFVADHARLNWCWWRWWWCNIRCWRNNWSGCWAVGANEIDLACLCT